ncbi:family 1 glycosylhydrolase [Bifidobacterium sp. ESL0764]|uniref:family 1 glycosylhydrolase n=1 Tax=Bifidobacterium sp. ESL0764 TaxID=2983228 RepID=UPI0023F74A8A|nr:family 1 glycosylhydrolase [Bifidobacterium sp. ESL0764]WEV65209.1 family 1 glycosylhydrolase [Bifidobacterium sp. ESL0764]
MSENVDAGEYRLPKGFLFGAATSPHQTEGDNTSSDWWQLEHADSTVLHEPSGKACDSWHRWRDDLGLLADNGFNAYRFGIEWARIEPEDGVVDQEALRHYEQLIMTAKAMGLDPVVTLYHFSLPVWFSKQGGWSSPRACEHFIRYVKTLLPILQGAAAIVTINEPNMVASLATVLSGKADMAAVGQGLLPDPDPTVTSVLARAHHEAVALLHKNLPGVPVGWSVANQNVQSEPGGEDTAARYSEAIEDQFIRVSGGDDFIGIQAYTRTVFDANGKKTVPSDDELTSNGWEYWPEAAAGALKHVQGLVSGVPMIVTENGISTKRDERRIAYTRDSLSAIARLMAQGYPILGYFHWSLLDNYEWGSWEPTFGLAYAGRESGTFDRVAKPSLAWLGDFARQGVLPTGQVTVGR